MESGIRISVSIENISSNVDYLVQFQEEVSSVINKVNGLIDACKEKSETSNDKTELKLVSDQHKFYEQLVKGLAGLNQILVCSVQVHEEEIDLSETRSRLNLDNLN